MEDNNYILSGDVSLAVSAAHADKLLALADGNCALLYLYALRFNGGFSAAKAAADLKRTETEIKNAAEKLRLNGLFSNGKKPAAALPADETPEYTSEEIAAQAAGRSEFPAIVEETQKILGKTLTGTDLKTLFGLYDYLKLPAEVIVLLVSHCAEFTRERSGPGRLPSMKTIEKEAYVWFNREIMTLEQAEDYLRAKRAISDATGEIKRILQINGRNFSATERAYVEGWLEMGFDAETIGIAYDRTVIKTGGLQWKYMDSIMASWDKKGLHTADEVVRGDKRGPAPKNTAAKPVRENSKIIDELMKQWAEK